MTIDIQSNNVKDTIRLNDFLKNNYLYANDINLEELKQTWLVENMILQGRVYELFGKWKGGKTLVGVDLAIALSNGQDWAGKQLQKSIVFYVAGESVEDIKVRILAWKQYHGETIGNLAIRNRPVHLTNEDHAHILRKEIMTIAAAYPELPVVIFIDTLNRNFGSGYSESSDEGMGKFVTHLLDIVVRPCNATGVVVHHSGHGDSERSRGHSSFAAAIDGSIKCNLEDKHITVSESFQRAKSCDDALSFRIVTQELPIYDNFDNPIDGAVIVFDEDHQPKPPPKKLGKKQQMALDTWNQLYDQHMETINAGKSKLPMRISKTELVNELVTKGEFKGNSYRLVNKLIEMGVFVVMTYERYGDTEYLMTSNSVSE